METKKKASQIWPEWDKAINAFGVWLVVGSISALSLPAVPGLIAIGTLIWLGLTKIQPINDDLFSEFRNLKEKEKGEKLTDEEEKEIDTYYGVLRRESKNRNSQLFKVSWSFIIVSGVYQLGKLFEQTQDWSIYN